LLEELDESMKKIKTSICLPLLVGEEYIGIIFLGNKPSASAYSKEELECLSIFSSHASISIANAMHYQQVRDYSLNLKKKVNEQTKDILEKNEHLKKLLEMRSEFLNITSHQLRTPVTVIKGTLDMLRKGDLSKEDRKVLIETAFNKSLKLGDIVNDILLASEMKSDKFDVQMERVFVDEVVKEVYNDKKIDAFNKKIELILKTPEKVSPVLSNAKYLKQAIYNLVNNALQYTLRGDITIKLTEENDKVFLRVIDTGIGIPQESLPKLFQRFSRAPNAVATFTDGTGLGLFIIKEIIESHKGAKVYVESTELGKGTTFTIELPKAKVI
jgi:signal transduction histidine kinase